MTSQVSDAKRTGSREERQAHSSNASGRKQVHNLADAENGHADPKVASSQVQVEATQPDAISSHSAEHKPGSGTAAPVQVQLVSGAAPGSVPASDDNTASVQVKIQTDGMKSEARPEPGEISNAVADGVHKEGKMAVSNGTELTVKLAVRVKGDGAVAGSAVATLPEPRLRDRYVNGNCWHRGEEGRDATRHSTCSCIMRAWQEHLLTAA